MTAKGQKLIEKNQDRLGRSLERLSTELYSKDTHFVLELIQVVVKPKLSLSGFTSVIV